MLTFAGSAYWRYTTVGPDIETPPAVAVGMRSSAVERGQRILASTGSRLPQRVPPNLSALWGMPSLGGYVSLENRRLADVLEMAPTGEVPQQSFAQDDDRILDLTATRFILAPPRPEPAVSASAASSGAELGGFVGADPLTRRKSVAYGFPTNTANSLELVSALGLSMTIRDGEHVADIQLRDAQKRLEVIRVVAGRDTSESAYDRPDVRAVVRHRKAHVFATDGTTSLYVARYPLPNARDFRNATVVWRYPDTAVGALTIAHLALVDERTHIAFPAAVYPPRWVASATTADETIFENPDALPGAWAVPSAVSLDDASQPAAIAEGRSDAPQRSFDPRDTALVPRDVHGFDGRGVDGVRVVVDEPTHASYELTCPARCVFVVDGLWYPGWNATVDATPAPVRRVDGLLRGVIVEGGRHVIEMWFAPLSLLVGASITTLSALVLILLCVRESVACSRRTETA